MKTYLDSIDPTLEGHVIIQLRREPGRILRFFGFRTSRARFIGSGTVWFTYPDFIRCSSSMEMRLCNIWTKWEHDSVGEKRSAGAKVASS